jgi:hypothetical protein
MSTTINVKTPAELSKAYKRIAQGIQGPFKSTRRMFVQLGTMIDRDTILTFKKEGGYQDRIKWPGFSPKTVKTKNGTWKIRYGTDLTGRPGMQGKYRPGIRRYSANSKLLQASGGFRNSFKIIKIGNEKMTYGTTHKLAGKIGSNPVRNPLQYTNKDQSTYTRTILNWWFKNTNI